MKWIFLAAFVLVLLFIPEISTALETFFLSPFRFALAVILGAIFYGWMTFKKEGEELPSFLKVLFFGANGLFFIAWSAASFFGKADLFDLAAHAGFLMFGMLVVALLERSYIPFAEKILSFFTKKAGTERDHLTDVREVARGAEKVQSAPSFNPENFYKAGSFFLGLDEKGEPIYWEGDLPHCQIVGTSGAGKGRGIGTITAQCALAGQPCFTPQGAFLADGRHFEPKRISAITIRHDLAVQKAKLEAMAMGWSGFLAERTLRQMAVKERTTWLQVPDAFAVSPKGRKVALEVERTVKTPKRYTAIFDSYCQMLADKTIQEVIYICTEDIKDRLERLFLKIETMTVDGKRHAFSESFRARFHFVTCEKWGDYAKDL
jgi:hypothetical protein